MKKLICILMLLISGCLAESCISYLLSREPKKEFEAYVSVNGEMCTYEKYLSGRIYDPKNTDAVGFGLPNEVFEHAIADIHLHESPKFNFSLHLESDSDCFYTNTQYTNIRPGISYINFHNMALDEFLGGSWVKFSYPSEASTDVFFYIDFEYVCPSEDNSETMLINGHIIVYNRSSIVSADWIRSVLKNKI